MEEVTRITAKADWPSHHRTMRREHLAWVGIRCCCMQLRERALRWRRRQAQLRR
jgi:hypothetical protein